MRADDVVRPGELVEKLRSAGVAHVDGSSRRRAEYSSDASLYRVRPSVVVFPRSTHELELIYTTCRSMGVPLTMRGGGTSIAGNAVGSGVVVDCSRHLDTIVDLDPEGRTA